MYSNWNAYFQLNNKKNGMYITLYPPAQDGERLTLAEIKDYLDAHKIVFDEQELFESLSKDAITEVMIGKETACIVNEDVLINISNNKMEASGRFYPPSTDGKQLGKEDILTKLSEIGVRHGIDKSAIDAWLEERQFCTDITLARGTDPEHGQGTSVEYKFALEKNARPALREDGSVDFHQLDLLNNVYKDDVLAVKIPEREGKCGTNVLGATVQPEKSAAKDLKYGQNVKMSEDGSMLAAACSGHVILDNDRVTVYDVYDVQGDVGAATGDIDFDGSVRISGDVNAGYSVKATGNIFVHGVVAGASLMAGGQIAVGLGINGGGKAKITAGGDISAKFIQEGLVASDGKIFSGSILNSKISAKDNIVVTSGKGLILGGELKTSTLIRAQVVGSARARVDTRLEIGPDALVAEQFDAVRLKLIGMRSKLKDWRRALGLIQQKMNSGETFSPEKAERVDALRKQISLLESGIKNEKQEYIRLKAEIDKSEAGRIVINSSIHDGAKITISNVSCYVRDGKQHCQFIKDGFEIKII